jgi:hypothetical protein
VTGPQAKNSSTKPLDWLAFALSCTCVLLPIWIVHYPAAADYWNHLLKAKIVADYDNPALGYSRFYQITLLPIPNMTTTLALALLMKVLPPLTAGKVLLSTYAIALPLSARYLIRGAGVRFRPLEYIGFTMVYNPCFWDGYVDFCLSVAIAQFAIGYWLRTRDVRPGNATAYLALAFLTYFTHLWGFVVLFAVTGMLAVRESRGKRLLWLGSAAIATVLLFIYSHATAERTSISYFGLTYTLSLARNFLSLPRLAGLPADAAHLASAALLIGIHLALLVVLVVLAARTKNRLFWIGVVLMVGFFFLPNQLGRMREPGQRTLVFVPTILAAAIATYPARRTARAVSLLMLGCIGFMLLFTARAWVAKDRDLAVYHEALTRIPAHSRVLDVVTLASPYLEWPWKLLGSDMYRSENWFGANYNIEKGGLYLNTFTTSVVKIRDKASPVKPWFVMQSGFQWPRWLNANRMTVRRAFDYIVIVGPRRQVAGVLLLDFEPYWRGRGVEVLKRRAQSDARTRT